MCAGKLSFKVQIFLDTPEMSEQDMVKLTRASDKAAEVKVQHILLSVTQDGQVHLNGSDNLIRGLVAQPDLFKQLKSNIEANKLDEGSAVSPAGGVVYPLLPCSPYSKDWPGSKEVRGILTRMLARAGYSRNGRNQSLGSGVAPVGWPEETISWASYKGSCRSGLRSEQVTHIIIKLLRATGLDEKTHIVVKDNDVSNEAKEQRIGDIDQDEEDSVNMSNNNDNIDAQNIIIEEVEEGPVDKKRNVGDL